MLLVAGTYSIPAKYPPPSTIDLAEPASGQICCFKKSFTSFGVIRPNGGSSRVYGHFANISHISDKNNKVLASVINHDPTKLELKAKNNWKKIVSI